MGEGDSSSDRLQGVPLWQWGCVVIVCGLFSYWLLQKLMPPQGDRVQQLAQQWGMAIATGLFVMIGWGLIIFHFFDRRNQEK